MKLNHSMKSFSTAGRRIATTLLCLVAIAVFWQGMSLSNTPAIASPATPVAATDVGNQVQGRASEGFGQAKDFIRDSKARVEQTAKKNAARVDQATDDDSFVEQKAKRDAARIEQRAEQDAARTQTAVDKTKNAVERTVDSIKDAFSS